MFQKLHKLNVTGLFDSATKILINKPRCGLPDLKNKLADYKLGLSET